jgi:hypothetical protein
MGDQPIEGDQENKTDYDTRDAEVPLVIHDAPTGSDAHSRYKYNRAQRYAAIALDWTKRILGYIWREGLWNRSFWTVAATVVVAFATTIYAIYASRQWRAMRESNEINRGNSPRPWVGVDESQIRIARDPVFTWPVSPTDLPTITLDLTFPIKNFGNSPALHEWSSAWIIPMDIPKEGISTQEPPTDLVNKICMTSPKGLGDVLLPGAIVHPRQGAIYWAGSIPSHHRLSIAWIAVCIKYEDSGDHGMHYSKYLYMSSHQVGLIPVPASPDHPDWTYVPFTGLILYNADAD